TGGPRRAGPERPRRGGGARAKGAPEPIALLLEEGEDSGALAAFAAAAAPAPAAAPPAPAAGVVPKTELAPAPPAHPPPPAREGGGVAGHAGNGQAARVNGEGRGFASPLGPRM